jgi:hypothetical protein
MRQRLENHGSLVGIISTLAGVIGAVAGVLAIWPSENSDSPEASPTSTTLPTSSIVPPSSLQPSPGDSPTYTTRNSASGYTIFIGDEIDLDTLPSGDSGDGLSEMSMDNEGVYISPLAQVAVLGTAVEPDYATCHDASGYVAGDKTADQTIEEGTYLCLKTSGKRYAALRLIQIGSLSWTFDIVTYDSPE